MAQRLKLAALFFGSLALFVAIAELALRFTLPEGYYVWPPNFRERFAPDRDVLKGANDQSMLTINAQGMRGDPMPGDDRPQLLAIGGSTTICTYLDDADAWPWLVQKRLEHELGPGAVWVGNVGRPGHTTTHHLLQMQKLLAQYPSLDGVLMLVGINDMVWRIQALRDPVKLPAKGSDQSLKLAFSVYPGWDADSPWYRRTGIARFLRSRSWRLPGQRAEGPLVDSRGEFVVRAREARSRVTSFLGDLPGMQEGLVVYRKSLNEIVDAAQAAGARLIFLTQPTLWREGLTPEEDASLWMGGPRFDRLGPGAQFHSVKALADGMARYNQALLDVCRERGVECIDAASLLPRNGIVFWDDAHLTVEGSHQLGRIVADYLRSRPLPKREKE